jgi:hypothetical protein
MKDQHSKRQYQKTKTQTELTQSFQLWMVIWCKEAGQRQHMLSFTGKGKNTVVRREKIIVLAPHHQNPPRDEEMNYEFLLLRPPSSIIEFVPYELGI